MIVQSFPSGPIETNAYVVACPQTHEAAIVDPAPESADTVISYITKAKLIPKMILLTHSHWDHIADVVPLVKHYSIPVYIHPFDAPNLEKPGSDKLPCWIPMQGIKPTFYLHEGESLTIGKLVFFVIHTPGHSPGSVCFYCPEAAILMSGDTLFRGSIGTLSIPTAQPDLMWGSLDKLATLPSDTVVYPGHGPSTTIGGETWLPKAQEHFGKKRP